MILATLAIIPILNLKNPVLPQPTPTTSVMVEKKRTPAETPRTYKVKENDTLTKIAKKYKTSWKRIYYKNKQLTNPDVLLVGQKLTIPKPSERLKARKIAIRTIPAQTSSTANFTGISRPTESTGTNGYFEGQCTTWVASQRYVPGGWGDASSWKASAISAGWTVSNTPVNGAIAWRWGHVAYVIEARGDTVLISEQNYDWNSGIRTIEVPTSSYEYIY